MSFPIDPTLMGVPAPPMSPAGPPTSALAIPQTTAVDPILQSLLSGPQVAVDPEMLLPPSKRKGYRPMPDEGYIKDVVGLDEQEYQPLLARFAQDLTLYRQHHLPNVPPGFHPLREIAFKSATISNVVNKLANMMSAGDWRYVVPFKDETSKNNSQIVENWLSYLRQCEEEDYTISGGVGSLQYDEAWYLLQYGRVITRILPDLSDPHHPYNESLLDPATCFPVWGDGKQGLVRMTRKYETSVIKVLETYGTWNSRRGVDLEKKIREAQGSDEREIGRLYHQTGTLLEYWDTWNRAVYFKDVEVMRDAHELGYVPFVVVLARGEPRSVLTPDGPSYYVDEHNNAIMPSSREDIREKGISVFHHLKNTHKMTEVVYTLLLSEVLKAQNPATITYSTQGLFGLDQHPIAFYPGASNKRILNQQQVDIVPTSPRPTDTSPVLNKVQADTTEGSINPAMYGSMDGSNIAGFAVESLISAARDTILPYTTAFEQFQALKGRMKAMQYVRQIAPSGVMMTAPMEGRYGSSPSEDVTPEIVKSTGYKVSVEMVGVSDSVLPAMINMAAQAVKEGIKSRRWAMEKTGDKDPSKMFRDIIAERAIEHPEIMENFIIPQTFIQNGQRDLAWIWGFMVVLPKMMQTMGGLMGGMVPPGMAGGTSGPPGMTNSPQGPGQNGMSNPMMGIAPGPPTGPLPGQGRQ